MDYPPEEDDLVIWQSSQAVALKLMFADAPVASAPPPSVPTPRPSTRTVSGTRPHGVKRKRRQEQDTPPTTSAETLCLIQQLSRTLGNRPSNSNLARRNTRVASAGNLNFSMPPPKPKPSGSDEASASDGASFNQSRSSTTSPLVAKTILDSSSDSNSTTIPCTPPNRILPDLRPATEPTIPVSALLDHARSESPELPPPPESAKPVISIRTDSDTVKKSAFSSRSNTTESATSPNGSDSFISVTEPISPTTPLATRPGDSESPDSPFLDLTELSPTPSPEPRIIYNPPSKPKPVEARASKVPAEASRPVPSVARAITDPDPPKRPPVLSSQHTRSEPSQSFKPPTQASFKPPTQQAFKPPTQAASKLPPVIRPTQQQQNPRTFLSSQSRLGLGAMGKGYSGVNKPFKIPNKGKGTVPLTVVPLPKKDSVGAGSQSRKKENIDAGRSKRGNSPAPDGRPSNRPTSGYSSRTASGSSSRTSVPSTRTASSRTTTGKHTQSRGTSGSRRELGSDDVYIGSDESFDADVVDADMAFWDSWDD